MPYEKLSPLACCWCCLISPSLSRAHSMDDAILTNANAAGAYFSASILDVKSLDGADFTDAQIPVKTVPQRCMRDDVTGKNPVTGVDTRESLMCP